MPNKLAFKKANEIKGFVRLGMSNLVISYGMAVTIFRLFSLTPSPRAHHAACQLNEKT
jgi:hypothetical protein